LSLGIYAAWRNHRDVTRVVNWEPGRPRLRPSSRDVLRSTLSRTCWQA